MYGTLSEDIELKVPARKAWSIFGTLELVKLAAAGKIFEAVEVVEGDGGTGTIIKVTFKTDIAGVAHHNEKTTKIDNQNMVKESEVVEGGFLDLGFNFYKYKLEIKDNPNGQSCLVKYKVEYDVKEEFAANASLITKEPFIALTNVASEHLLKSN